ncbi:ABC transporter substrate-binding protein [Sedimentisphaera salicampi]|uniref:Putative ABC transporter-binding protein n=1 Tax=Sedimentisphaera salicampi TaxID=1941349 RepID=A0A1W6LK70_9BACT|nr:extracellular solute-binding protein [Sedimentisphaera salicampi]ARN56155.1 putative ABC transporter-binding protein precursor [Sedimentisphaera salicampi]
MNSSRRQFLTTYASLAAGATFGSSLFLSGCRTKKTKKRSLKLGVTGWSAQGYRKVIEELGFTEQTGIEVEVIVRPNATNELLTQMASSVLAGTSPYDLIDLEDSAAMSLSRSRWLMGLDNLIDQSVWDDFTPQLMEMTKVWDQYEGQTFRVHHNFEMCYWWYRKDWFEQKGIALPKTWDEVKEMGEIFTDKNRGIWASEEALMKNSYLSVYLEWLGCQAGSSPYELDDNFRDCLKYAHDLIFKHRVMNPACTQKNYDQQNNDYIADRVAFMRQWPFFYDVCKQHKDWYSDEKVACGLPPVGPGGKTVSTFAAGWGWAIPNTSLMKEEACQLLKFFINTENASKMPQYSDWFLNARKSVLASTKGSKLAEYLKMYLDAGVVGTRPFHQSRYTEALAKVENVASAYLTNQINLDQAMASRKLKLERL